MERQFNMLELKDLSYEKLFQMAEEKFNELDYQQAEIYYEAAYNQKPHEDMIVLCYSHILKQNQKADKAKAILENSLNTDPNGTYKRYFELAEIYTAEDSINIFEKGIKKALNSLSNPFLNTTPEKQIKRDISQAYASIAQICMTDLSHIPYQQVQAKCIEVLEKGLAIDPTCMDIHLQKANCLIEKDRNEQAKAELFVIKQSFMEQKQQYQDQLILQCARYFMELAQFTQCIEILQKLNESQNNEAEIVYLLAYCAFQLKKYQQCRQYVQEYPQGEVEDQEIEEAMKQLKQQLAKKMKGNDETEQGNQDEDWIDVQEDEM